MKDFVNPVLLLVVIVLMVCRVAVDTPEAADALMVSLFTVCATAVLVDGALGMARALARRASIRLVLWAGVFFVLGCFSWTLKDLACVERSEEQQVYQELVRTQSSNPLERDAEGESMLTRAAALGEVEAVHGIMGDPRLTEEDLCEAGMRAAENNKTAVLDELARRGMSAKSAVQGTPLLHAAAQNAACAAMEWLLKRGAQPNSRDAEGATPLIHATLADSAPAVKLLLEYGANPRLRDATGQGPADYARSEEVEELLLAEKR